MSFGAYTCQLFGVGNVYIALVQHIIKDGLYISDLQYLTIRRYGLICAISISSSINLNFAINKNEFI